METVGELWSLSTRREGRLETSHWSGATEILCSDWLLRLALFCLLRPRLSVKLIRFLGTLWSSGLPASTSAAVHSKLMVITETDFIEFKVSKFIRGEASEYVC